VSQYVGVRQYVDVRVELRKPLRRIARHFLAYLELLPAQSLNLAPQGVLCGFPVRQNQPTHL